MFYTFTYKKKTRRQKTACFDLYDYSIVIVEHKRINNIVNTILIINVIKAVLEFMFLFFFERPKAIPLNIDPNIG